MQAVEIGDRIMFNRDGDTNELELWTVIDGGLSYPAVRQIGIDLLNTVQYKDGSPTDKTLLQHGLQAGYIRLVSKIHVDSQETLSGYLSKMQNTLTMNCMKHWRALGERRATPQDGAQIRQDLEEIEKTLKYALNCCHWIINGWDKTKE